MYDMPLIDEFEAPVDVDMLAFEFTDTLYSNTFHVIAGSDAARFMNVDYYAPNGTWNRYAGV